MKPLQKPECRGVIAGVLILKKSLVQSTPANTLTFERQNKHCVADFSQVKHGAVALRGELDRWRR